MYIKEISIKAGLQVLVFSILFLWATNQTSVNAESLKSLKLCVGLGYTNFLSVNRMDAEAAFKVILKIVGKKKGYDLTLFKTEQLVPFQEEDIVNMRQLWQQYEGFTAERK